MSSLMRKTILCLAAFMTMSVVILHRHDWRLMDFDQTFYVTIAYDLDKYGVFSNGPLSTFDATATQPQPGMFFGPVFPLMVFITMKLDARFAAAVRCSVEVDRGQKEADCEAYEVPIRLLNAFLLAIGVLAVASAAELILRRRGAFFLAGLFTLAGLAADADIFSYVMTESTIFAIYSIFIWAALLAWKTDRLRYYLASGCLLGILCLTKPSFLVLFPAISAMGLFYGYWLPTARRAGMGARLLAFTVAFACVMGAWVARNAVSVGKWGLTEEYGSAALIERFAYDNMTAREFIQAFPYCAPGIGDLAFDLMYGTDSMHRFVYHTPGSFFNAGRGRRETLVQENGRLDPLIGNIIRNELRANWWRYVLVTIPLAWCGMWPGWIVSLLLLPCFAWACWRAARTREWPLICYSAPAILMLGLDAAVGNHYTRYNIILLGPYAIGTAWIMSSALLDGRWRSQFPAPAP